MRLTLTVYDYLFTKNRIYISADAQPQYTRKHTLHYSPLTESLKVYGIHARTHFLAFEFGVAFKELSPVLWKITLASADFRLRLAFSL